MNDDLEQMRQLHARLTAHQMLALEVIAAADVLQTAAAAFMDKPDCIRAWAVSVEQAGHQGPLTALRPAMDDYCTKRANFERVMIEHENG